MEWWNKWDKCSIPREALYVTFRKHPAGIYVSRLELYLFIWKSGTISDFASSNACSLGSYHIKLNHVITAFALWKRESAFKIFCLPKNRKRRGNQPTNSLTIYSLLVVCLQIILYQYIYVARWIAWNMILVLWWEFSIHESDIRVICKHIFLMFQALIFDVATIIYQCSLYNSKIYIRKLKNI